MVMTREKYVEILEEAYHTLSDMQPQVVSGPDFVKSPVYAVLVESLIFDQRQRTQPQQLNG